MLIQSDYRPISTSLIRIIQAFIMSLSKPLGEISGLAMNAKGQLVAFHRGDRVWDEKLAAFSWHN